MDEAEASRLAAETYLPESPENDLGRRGGGAVDEEPGFDMCAIWLVRLLVVSIGLEGGGVIKGEAARPEAPLGGCGAKYPPVATGEAVKLPAAEENTLV